MKPIATAILLALIMPGIGHTQSDPPELSITKATIKSGKVYVKGHGAIPGEPVYWLTSGIFNFSAPPPVRDTVDDQGRFSFVTDDLPALPRCYAEVIVGALDQEVTITVDNCKGTVVDFYVVSNNPSADPENMIYIAPGESGSVSASCRPGDSAVSSNYYISTNTNTPANASILADALSIDSRTQIQSRGVTIFNHGEVDTELRVSAVCAEVKPPASRSPAKKQKAATDVSQEGEAN